MQMVNLPCEAQYKGQPCTVEAELPDGTFQLKVAINVPVRPTDPPASYMNMIGTHDQITWPNG